MPAEPTNPNAAAVEHAHHVAHHFDSAEQEFESGKLGMWIFLATEVMLFGGMFLLRRRNLATCWFFHVGRSLHRVID